MASTMSTPTTDVSASMADTTVTTTTLAKLQQQLSSSLMPQTSTTAIDYASYISPTTQHEYKTLLFNDADKEQFAKYQSERLNLIRQKNRELGIPPSSGDSRLMGYLPQYTYPTDCIPLPGDTHIHPSREEQYKAAGLLPYIFSGDDVLILLGLERRTDQSLCLAICGGKRDETDYSSLHTAVREFEEETGNLLQNWVGKDLFWNFNPRQITDHQLKSLVPKLTDDVIQDDEESDVEDDKKSTTIALASKSTHGLTKKAAKKIKKAQSELRREKRRQAAAADFPVTSDQSFFWASGKYVLHMQSCGNVNHPDYSLCNSLSPNTFRFFQFIYNKNNFPLFYSNLMWAWGNHLLTGGLCNQLYYNLPSFYVVNNLYLPLLNQANNNPQILDDSTTATTTTEGSTTTTTSTKQDNEQDEPSSQDLDFIKVQRLLKLITTTKQQLRAAENPPPPQQQTPTLEIMGSIDNNNTLDIPDLTAAVTEDGNNDTVQLLQNNNSHSNNNNTVMNNNKKNKKMPFPPGSVSMKSKHFNKSRAKRVNQPRLIYPQFPFTHIGLEHYPPPQVLLDATAAATTTTTTDNTNTDGDEDNTKQRDVIIEQLFLDNQIYTSYITQIQQSVDNDITMAVDYNVRMMVEAYQQQKQQEEAEAAAQKQQQQEKEEQNKMQDDVDGNNNNNEPKESTDDYFRRRYEDDDDYSPTLNNNNNNNDDNMNNQHQEEEHDDLLAKYQSLAQKKDEQDAAEKKSVETIIAKSTSLKPMFSYRSLLCYLLPLAHHYQQNILAQLKNGDENNNNNNTPTTNTNKSLEDATDEYKSSIVNYSSNFYPNPLQRSFLGHYLFKEQYPNEVQQDAEKLTKIILQTQQMIDFFTTTHPNLDAKQQHDLVMSALLNAEPFFNNNNNNNEVKNNNADNSMTDVATTTITSTTTTTDDVIVEDNDADKLEKINNLKNELTFYNDEMYKIFTKYNINFNTQQVELFKSILNQRIADYLQAKPHPFVPQFGDYANTTPTTSTTAIGEQEPQQQQQETNGEDDIEHQNKKQRNNNNNPVDTMLDINSNPLLNNIVKTYRSTSFVDRKQSDVYALFNASLPIKKNSNNNNDNTNNNNTISMFTAIRYLAGLERLITIKMAKLKLQEIKDEEKRALLEKQAAAKQLKEQQRLAELAKNPSKLAKAEAKRLKAERKAAEKKAAAVAGSNTDGKALTRKELRAKKREEKKLKQQERKLKEAEKKTKKSKKGDNKNKDNENEKKAGDDNTMTDNADDAAATTTTTNVDGETTVDNDKNEVDNDNENNVGGEDNNTDSDEDEDDSDSDEDNASSDDEEQESVEEQTTTTTTSATNNNTEEDNNMVDALNEADYLKQIARMTAEGIDTANDITPQDDDEMVNTADVDGDDIEMNSNNQQDDFMREFREAAAAMVNNNSNPKRVSKNNNNNNQTVADVQATTTTTTTTQTDDVKNDTEQQQQQQQQDDNDQAKNDDGDNSEDDSNDTSTTTTPLPTTGPNGEKLSKNQLKKLDQERRKKERLERRAAKAAALAKIEEEEQKNKPKEEEEENKLTKGPVRPVGDKQKGGKKEEKEQYVHPYKKTYTAPQPKQGKNTSTGNVPTTGDNVPKATLLSKLFEPSPKPVKTTTTTAITPNNDNNTTTSMNDDNKLLPETTLPNNASNITNPDTNNNTNLLDQCDILQEVGYDSMLSLHWVSVKGLITSGVLLPSSIFARNLLSATLSQPLPRNETSVKHQIAMRNLYQHNTDVFYNPLQSPTHYALQNYIHLLGSFLGPAMERDTNADLSMVTTTGFVFPTSRVLWQMCRDPNAGFSTYLCALLEYRANMLNLERFREMQLFEQWSNILLSKQQEQFNTQMKMVLQELERVGNNQQ